MTAKILKFLVAGYLLGCFFSGFVFALEPEIGGHVKLQATGRSFNANSVNAALGPRSYLNYSTDLRTNVSSKFDSFETMAAFEYLGVGGNGIEAQRAVAGLDRRFMRASLLPNDHARLFNLTSKLSDEQLETSVLRLDRVYLGYLGEKLVLRFGRQAVSWGNALAFQVLDPFNPFSPTEIDRDYKTGDDLAYLQYLFDNGDDIQALVVPRRDVETNDIESSESSFALKLHHREEAVASDFDLVLARHYDENLFGVGVSKDIMQAVARIDLALTELKDNSKRVGVVANIDRSWEVLGYNFYTFVEYYRNATGVGNGDYSSLNDNLLSRVSRGEVFTLGRNYLATGGRIELTALSNLYSNVIFNLHDQSGVVQFRLEQSLLQDLLFTVGINLPYGATGSEFGGLEVPALDAVLSPADEIYLRLSYFY
jgi:hypothetical protein